MKNCPQCGAECSDLAFACVCDYEFKAPRPQVTRVPTEGALSAKSSAPTLDTFKLGRYVTLIGLAFVLIGAIIIATNLPVSVAPQEPNRGGWQAQMLQGINTMAAQMSAADENLRRAAERSTGIMWLVAGAVVAAVGLALRSSSVRPSS